MYQLKNTIMTDLSPCPNCQSTFVYENSGLLICPECSHEWTSSDKVNSNDDPTIIIRDANGNEIKDGDSVIITKDLKIKGSSSIVKAGTKVKNIRLVDGDHDIDCKIPGIGAMGLKSQFVKKVID